MGNILCDVLWKCRRCRTGHAVSDYPVAFQNHAVALCGTHVRRAENKGCLVDLGRLGNRAPVLWEPRRNNSDVQQHLWFYRRMVLNIPGLWDPGQSIIHESFVSLFSTVSCACMNDFGGWPGLDADDQDVAAWFLARDLQSLQGLQGLQGASRTSPRKTWFPKKTCGFRAGGDHECSEGKGNPKVIVGSLGR